MIGRVVVLLLLGYLTAAHGQLFKSEFAPTRSVAAEHIAGTWNGTIGDSGQIRLVLTNNRRLRGRVTLIDGSVTFNVTGAGSWHIEGQTLTLTIRLEASTAPIVFTVSDYDGAAGVMTLVAPGSPEGFEFMRVQKG